MIGQNIREAIISGAILTVWLEFPGVHASLDWDSEEICGSAKAVGKSIDEALVNLNDAAKPIYPDLSSIENARTNG